MNADWHDLEAIAKSQAREGSKHDFGWGMLFCAGVVLGVVGWWFNLHPDWLYCGAICALVSAGQFLYHRFVLFSPRRIVQSVQEDWELRLQWERENRYRAALAYGWMFSALGLLLVLVGLFLGQRAGRCFLTGLFVCVSGLVIVTLLHRFPGAFRETGQHTTFHPDPTQGISTPASSLNRSDN